MEYTTRLTSEKASGVKFYIGENLCIEEDVEDFLRDASCSLEGVDGIDCISNPLIAKYYDYITGYIYFHFKSPVFKYLLEGFFHEDEILPELED